MRLFSFFRKNKQESSSGEGSFYSRAEVASNTMRSRGKRQQEKSTDMAVDPVLPEKKRARRRLVGAIALVLAAIIGLPMILDSEPKQLASDIAIKIPSKDKVPAGNEKSDATAAPTGSGKVATADALDKMEEMIEPSKPITPVKPKPVPRTEVIAGTAALTGAALAGAKNKPKSDIEPPETTTTAQATKLEIKPILRPEPKPEPKPLVKPEPSESKHLTRPESKPEQKQIAKPELQPEPKHVIKEPKPEQKTVKPEPEPKHTVKVEPKPEQKQILKPELPPEVKHVNKAEPSAELKQIFKPEPKPAIQAGTKLDEAGRVNAILEGKSDAKATADASADKGSGKFIVQIAALASHEKASELQGKLKDAGIRSYTQKVVTESGERIRIRVGPFSSKEEADKVRDKLGKLGLNGTLVPS